MFLRNCSITLLLLGLGVPGFAQAVNTGQSDATSLTTAHRSRVRDHGPLCWKQAGMTPDMVNQRWYIEDQQKVKIAQVCSEPTTSAQQKHDKINEIQADTERELEGVIPVKSLAVFNKCQAELDQRRPKPPGQKELGPCGGVIPSTEGATGTAPEHSHTNAPTHR